MTTSILLIRHGETESNALGMQGRHMGWLDDELNSTGLKQAESVALRLAKVPISAIYSSSSARALHTAQIMGKSHGLKPVSTPDLREINYGDWEGRKRGEMRDKYPEIHRQFQIDPMLVTIPGGESFKQVTQRVISVFNDATGENEGKTLALVSHSFPLKILVVYALGEPYFIWNRFGIGNASISIIQVNDGVPRLITLNDRAHLEA